MVLQLVTESVLVAVLGGALGLLLASIALRVIVTSGADLIPRAVDIGLDPMALVFTIVVTLVTGIAIGLLPALQASAVNVVETLKEASRGSTGTGQRLRAGLLVAEVSLSVVLLVGASLLLMSFARLQRVDPGFKPDGLFTAQLVLPPQRFDREKLVAFYEQLLSAPLGAARDLVCCAHGSGAADGQSDAGAGRRAGDVGAAAERTAEGQSPSRLAAIFSDAGHSDSRRAGVRRTRLRARAARGDRQRDVRATVLRRRGSDRPDVDHGHGPVAVAGGGCRGGRAQHDLSTPPEADYFLPALQRPETFTNVLVRTNGNPVAIAPLVRDALRSVDPDLPLLQPQALTTSIAQTVADRRLALVLLASFAALALLLASLGVYSVMAHLVTFRTSEIGIRMALGATPGTVMRMVLGHSSRLTLVGIVLGVAGGLAVSRLMQQALFEVNPANPLVLSRRVGHALARRRLRVVVSGAAGDED